MPLPRQSTSITAAALTMAVAVHSAAAQAVPSFELTKRVAKSKYAYGRLYAVRELADGRVMLSDLKEGTFRLVDLSRGDDQLFGTQGDGAGQYRRGTLIIPWLGDSLLLYDAAGRKFLHVSATGQLGAETPYASPSVRFHFAGSPMGSDPSGSLYYQTSDIDTTAKPPAITNSIRRLAAGGQSDLVTPIATMRKDQIGQQGMQPFPFHDAWAVRSSDGLVARVVADTYQVIWFQDGREIGRTGPLPDQPIPITEAVAQQYKDSVTSAMKAMMAGSGAGSQIASFGSGSVRVMAIGGDAGVSAGGGMQTITFTRGGGGDVVTSTSDGRGGGRAGGPPADVKVTPLDPSKLTWAPFPATMPPIPGGGVTLFDANGRLWVERSRPHGERNPRFDVIVEGKGVVAHVTIPADTRLAAVGRFGAYLIHSDADGDWLERYALPKLPIQ